MANSSSSSALPLPSPYMYNESSSPTSIASCSSFCQILIVVILDVATRLQVFHWSDEKSSLHLHLQQGTVTKRKNTTHSEKQVHLAQIRRQREMDQSWLAERSQEIREQEKRAVCQRQMAQKNYTRRSWRKKRGTNWHINKLDQRHGVVVDMASASYEDESASKGKEERAISTSDPALKLKKQLSSPNYNSVCNKITPTDYRYPDARKAR
ncbi:hypothetical protein DVH05_024742 [Phytophthora capsici]|nr:hypothetical protein DVH05_024742 [Phytophthora capsici]